MARRAARKSRSEPARGHSPARYAAGSPWSFSPLPNVPLSHPAFNEPVSEGRRPYPSRPRVVRGSLTRKAPPRGVSFGPWSLPSSVVHRAVECVRRGERRQVLFAKRATGAGARARKKHFSNRSCK